MCLKLVLFNVLLHCLASYFVIYLFIHESHVVEDVGKWLGEGNGFELVEGGGRTRDEGVVHSLGQRLGGDDLTCARGVRLPL